MSSYLAQYLDQALSTQKRAAAGTERPVTEAALAMLGEGPIERLMPGITGMVEPISALSGAHRGAAERSKKNLAWNLLPGVASAERGQRVRQTVNAANDRGGHGTANALSEYLGPVLSSLPTAFAGGVLGNKLYKDHLQTVVADLAGPNETPLTIAGKPLTQEMVQTGSIAGGVAVGAALPMLAAALLAAVTRTRSKNEQLEHDASGVNALGNYVIPGAASYNRYKRQGAATNYGNEGIR